MESLSDSDELEAKRLIWAAKFPCEFRTWMQRHGWVCDTKCPVREPVVKELEKYFREKEHEKYEKEFPDN